MDCFVALLLAMTETKSRAQSTKLPDGVREGVFVNDLRNEISSAVHSSCPGLTRASTSYFLCGRKNVDGRAKASGSAAVLQTAMPSRDGVTTVHELAQRLAPLHKPLKRLGIIRMPARQRRAVFDDVAGGPLHAALVEVP